MNGLSAHWPEVYVDLIDRAKEHGQARASRNGATLDLGPTTFHVHFPAFVKLDGRGGKVEFALIEQLCYLAGRDPEPLLLVAPRYERYREPDGTWWGAYGPRLFTQLPHVVRELSRHPDSRRAVALLYDRHDLLGSTRLDPPRDIPCTLSLGFWREDDELLCHAMMRSTDLWFGLYYDVPAFHMLQRAVAFALGLEAGELWFTTTSLHLYEEHWDRKVHATVLASGQLNWSSSECLYEDGFRRFLWLQRWASQELTEYIQLLTSQVQPTQ